MLLTATDKTCRIFLTKVSSANVCPRIRPNSSNATCLDQKPCGYANRNGVIFMTTYSSRLCYHTVAPCIVLRNHTSLSFIPSAKSRSIPLCDDWSDEAKCTFVCCCPQLRSASSYDQAYWITLWKQVQFLLDATMNNIAELWITGALTSVNCVAEPRITGALIGLNVNQNCNGQPSNDRQSYLSDPQAICCTLSPSTVRVVRKYIIFCHALAGFILLSYRMSNKALRWRPVCRGNLPDVWIEPRLLRRRWVALPHAIEIGGLAIFLVTDICDQKLDHAGYFFFKRKFESING